MVYCCVPNCTSESSKCDKKVTFHTFPIQTELKDRWRTAISRQGKTAGSLWSPSSSSRVCSLHFRTSDFSISTTRKRLLPNVVPTLFQGYPLHKQSKLPKRSPASRSDVSPQIKRKKVCIQNENKELAFLSEDKIEVKEVGIQVSSFFPCRPKLTAIKHKYKLVKQSNGRLIQTVSRLRKQIKELKKENNGKNNKHLEKIEKIEKDGKNGNLKALFLLEQIDSYGKQHVVYGETTLKICVLWHRKAAAGYRFIRSMNCLKLPHEKTLRGYIGCASGETGITSVIKERLIYEVSNLNHSEEKLGSLIIDEMAIKAKVSYDRNLDQFLGYSEAEIEEMGVSDKIANRLLCFMFRGLSTPIRIPVAFYFTRQLTGPQLCKLTKKVIEEVEETGFEILRIVTDNSSVNVSMMKEVCGGQLLPEIQHPNDENRVIFLSFDSSHILKNIRTQFLQKNFFYRGIMISSKPLKKLYDAQKHCTVKPVRCLNRKVVYPSNIEKMNVQRAKYVFSLPLTAALKTLPTIAPELVENHESLAETIRFLEYVRKWHDIHDVCNTKQAYMSRNTDKLVFTEFDDDRLSWLLDTFLPYMENIQKSSSKQNKLSEETYEALVVTTQATVKCIQHLISVGFHFVLSRNLSSDDIELLFSHLRRKGGFNDMMDARACMYAIDTTLKTGLINPSATSNVERQTFKTLDAIAHHKRISELNTVICDVPVEATGILDENLEETPVTLQIASLAMIAGYLVRVAEENFNCAYCLEQISTPDCDSPLLRLIKMQDRGGLRYPSRKFVFFLSKILKFTCVTLKHLGRKQLIKKLKVFLVPKFLQYFKCSLCSQEKLANTIITKFLKPILDNEARSVTDKIDKPSKIYRKPLSRKILKL
ncbi:uncharacterized protein LOC134540457 [Bacillus rossius redtenbacheri]|uniref:uncharacterized protein LOC134540457 n=1 Tax=Bacillus rossius redtenbacheri TaxID=93214 RepID=UPI002FDC8143